MAVHSPVTGYEPSVTFDLHAPGQTPPNILSRRSGLCSQATAIDNAPTITLSASQSWKQRNECLTSSQPTQDREASYACASFYYYEREDSRSTALRSPEKPVVFPLFEVTHKKTPAETKQVLEKYSSFTKEGELSVHKKLNSCSFTGSETASPRVGIQYRSTS